MQENRIAVALELPGLDILWQRDGAICPGYGVVTTKLHNSSRQRKRDRRSRDKVVFLMLTKRRFRCFFCGKVFIPEPAQQAYLPCHRSPP